MSNNIQDTFRISVIIPVYKRFEFLKDSLVSAFMQDFKSFEIIVADDGSPNFPQAEINRLIKENNKNNIKTTVLHPAVNSGTVRNLNNAIEQSNGELIVILAFDDAFYDSSVLSRISETFEREKCDILFTRRMQCDENLNPTNLFIPNDSQLAKIKKKLVNCESIYKRRIIVDDYDFGSGSAMYYRKQFFNDAGQYDTRYRLWEDGPFIAKVMRNGCKYCFNYNLVSIKYRAGGVSASQAPSEIMLNDFTNYYNYEYEPFKERFSFIQRKYVKLREKKLDNLRKGKKNGFVIRLIDKLYRMLISVNS